MTIANRIDNSRADAPSRSDPPSNTEIPPATGHSAAGYAPQVVIDSMRGVFLARALYAASALGIPDRLAAGARRCTELADELGLQPRPLHQVLRAIAGTGLLRTVPGPDIGPAQQFELTPLGEALRADHSSGTRDLILTMQGPSIQASLTVLAQRLASTRTGPELALGSPFFDHLAKNPGEARAFDRMMVAIHGAESEAVADGYDFSWARTIVDVGGGVGGFLCSLLRRHEQLTGIVADLPEVADRARRHLIEQGMAQRCGAVGADFFERVPSGADAYLLSYVLHNWDDESCVAILRTCAAAMTAHSRLLVVEAVLPADDSPHPGKLLDLVMVALTRGVERERREYRQLAERAGLRLVDVIPTGSPVSVLELVLAR